MKVYLSATYKDLADYRKSAYQQLRRLRHDVIGMEDYVAADERPADKCLADIADSDVYLGIFAWRYGFVPPKGNPKKQSITELEYRHARALKKPCLIFLSQEDAPWPVTMTDSHTGDAGAGTHIKRLRAELGVEHVVSYFTTPDQLSSFIAGSMVSIAVGPAIAQHGTVPPGSTRRAATGNAKPRKKYEKLWEPGSVLRVRFMKHKPEFESEIRRYLPLWSVYGNIRFEFSEDEDAEVRISVLPDQGNWAYVGTDCMNIPLNEPTMNFAFLEPAEIHVLHEFGHVLGLLHEHNHPKGIKWKKDAVYKAMGAPPNFWDKATTDTNMFSRWDAAVYPVPKPFDPVSVMAYPMPRDWSALDTDFGYKDSLSTGDKEFIEDLYPFARRKGKA